MSTVATPVFDIEKMAKDTELPVWKIKEMLDIPLEGICTAKSLDQAEQEFHDADDENPEQKQVILLEMIKLCSTVDEVLEVDDNHVQGGSGAEFMVFERLKELMPEELEKFSLVEDLRDLYKRLPTPRQNDLLSYEVHIMVVKKWLGSCMRVEEVIDVHDNIEFDSPVEQIVFDALMEMLDTLPLEDKIKMGELPLIYPHEKFFLQKLATSYGYQPPPQG